MTRKGMLFLIVSATAFSTLPIFMKIAFQAGVNVVTLLAFRFLFSAIFCFGALQMTRQSKSLRLNQRWRVMLLGVVHVAVAAFYGLSVNLLPASLTGLVFYMYPALVAALAVCIGWEKINRLKMAAIIICFAGLLQVMGVSFGEISKTGLVFGLVAAFGQACHVLLSHHIIQNLSPLLTVAWSALATSAAFFLYGISSGTLQWTATVIGWGAILGTGFFANFIGIICFFTGMRITGPSDASVVMNLEPVLTVVLSVLLLEESFGAWQGVGGAIIICGLYILHKGESAT